MSPVARILHVLTIHIPDFSGEGVFVERCCPRFRELAPAVHHHLLVTSTPAPPNPQLTCTNLDMVFYLTRSRLPFWRRELALVWWFVRNLPRYRVVHFRTHADRYFITYLLTKLYGKRLILSATLDDSVPAIVRSYRPSRRWLAACALRLFDGFVSISRKLYEETSLCVPPRKCFLIENGIPQARVDPDIGAATRERLGIPLTALVLVYVGGLCERKDPLFLVRSHRAILRARPDCRLMLVGPILEPNYFAEMQRLIEAEQIQDRVVFVGRVADPHPYYAAADIMVFASRMEGFGMVVPEAMGHGLPVVVRHLPGVNDSFVNQGTTGFLFSDAHDYERGVLHLAADPELRRSIGDRARVLVRAKYDMMMCARAYLDVYTISSPGAWPDISNPRKCALPAFSS